MGDWSSLGQELVDSYMTGDDENMKELGELIRNRIGCSGCEARHICDDYKDSVFDGKCENVLNSFFSDTEDEDTREQRAKEEQEARELYEQDMNSWKWR